jgi:carbon-monoxide dehydrogenase small subunit
VPSQHPISLTVNGVRHDLEVPANRLLIDLLRYDLGLTGTKESCSIGVCGACTIMVNGEMLSACLALAVQYDGAEITTIEGLAQGDQLHPIQEAFIEYGGFQCGICTPGQIMAAKALLDENPAPSTDEVKEWMTGNLCRCTGYYKIIESIEAAAVTLRSGAGV